VSREGEKREREKGRQNCINGDADTGAAFLDVFKSSKYLQFYLSYILFAKLVVAFLKEFVILIILGPRAINATDRDA